MTFDRFYVIIWALFEGVFMKLIYNESLTKNIVENYFKTHEDIDGELEITCGVRKVPIGRSLVPHEFPTISFRLKGTMESEGEVHPIEVQLSEQEVENAITTMVEASGRTVKRISIQYDEKNFKQISVDASAKRKVKK